MSTTEKEKPGDEMPDDETDWLYGDDNSVEEETTEKEVFSALIGDVEGVNGLNYKESESDSDDDVHVTIGDIKTGGSRGLSLGSSGINLNIKSSAAGSELDLDGEGNLSKVEVFDEKPWKKPGADLSDYFNYGFNEDSWKSYCEKQRRLCMGLEILSLGSSSRISKLPRFSDSSDYSSSLSRKPSSSITIIEGQTGAISRVEGRRRHSAEENNIKLVSDKSTDSKLSSPKLPFFPPNIPPPPFPPPSLSSGPPLLPPPPGFPLPPRVHPSMIPSLDGGRLPGSFDGRPLPPFPFLSGLYSAVGVASWPNMADNEKTWESYSRHKERERERTRERERGHKRERERARERHCRETEQEQTPPSQDHRNENERTSRPYRDHSRSSSERHRESSGREDDHQRHRERRHRDRSEHRSSHSSYSRRRHESDDADSHRRHRHKRSRHVREGPESSEELTTADQENQPVVTE